MDKQPVEQAQPQYSPDGKWWWDGTKWVPVEQGRQPAVSPGPPRRRVSAGRKVLLAVVGGSVLLLMGICTVAVASNPQTQHGARAGASAAAGAPAATAAPPQAPKTQ